MHTGVIALEALLECMYQSQQLTQFHEGCVSRCDLQESA